MEESLMGRAQGVDQFSCVMGTERGIKKKTREPYPATFKEKEYVAAKIAMGSLKMPLHAVLGVDNGEPVVYLKGTNGDFYVHKNGEAFGFVNPGIKTGGQDIFADEPDENLADALIDYQMVNNFSVKL